MNVQFYHAYEISRIYRTLMNHGRFGSDVPETAEPEKMPGSLQKKVSILSGQTPLFQSAVTSP
jgi:hypothetical protein